ncbi:hypothetical protein BX070DRAFT_124801 [Coemansia spiralis]|nr:hypothetical protein BX070DRAFT_124801 [Coemansia spiralis]
MLCALFTFLCSAHKAMPLILYVSLPCCNCFSFVGLPSCCACYIPIAAGPTSIRQESCGETNKKASFAKRNIVPIVSNPCCCIERKKSKAANSEAACTETLILPVPLVACSPLNTDALEFTHFIRIEIVIPSWLSSDRHVYTDVPVQLLTCELHSAARILHRQASLTNLERKGTESDSSSVVSVKSNRSTMFRPLSDDSMERHGTVLSSEGKAAVLSALPPRYCDVHTVQRPSPTLILLKQANSGAPVDSNQESNNALQRLSRQSQSTTRHTTMSSLQSIECRSVASTSSTADELAEEKYRTRQLPPPPPLPLEPMPTSNLVPASAYSSKLQAPVRSSTHSHGSTISSLSQTQPQLRKGSNPSALSPFSPGDAPSNPDLATVQQGLAALSFSGPPIVVSNGGNQKMPPGSAGHVRTPVSPLYNENLTPGTYSDDDAGYFKSSANKKSIERGRAPERSLFRLRKNSSIKQSR